MHSWDRAQAGNNAQSCCAAKQVTKGWFLGTVVAVPSALCHPALRAHTFLTEIRQISLQPNFFPFGKFLVSCANMPHTTPHHTPCKPFCGWHKTPMGWVLPDTVGSLCRQEHWSGRHSSTTTNAADLCACPSPGRGQRRES
jgi:hypothetical protein